MDKTIELYNVFGVMPKRWHLWITFYYIDCPQYLSFRIFDRNGVKPFLFRFSDLADGKYIGVLCRIPKKRLDDFLVCMEELQRVMYICGYSDYEKFCREEHDKLVEENANE